MREETIDDLAAQTEAKPDGLDKQAEEIKKGIDQLLAAH